MQTPTPRATAQKNSLPVLATVHCCDVARFTAVRLQGVFFRGGKTRNITIQLVLQQSRKTSCTFYRPLNLPYARRVIIAPAQMALLSK